MSDSQPWQDHCDATYSGRRYSRSAGLFSFGPFNVFPVFLRIRFRRPHLREAPGDLRSRPPYYGMVTLIQPSAPLAMPEIVIATWHEVNGLLGLAELKLSGS